MRIIDRYVFRQVLAPFCIGLIVFTFILIVPQLIEHAEAFIAKGVPVSVVLRLMATLLPMALGLSIPMSLLLGLLVAFGRLSSDRELVALQACGVSVGRLLRPVALVSLLGWMATSYVLLWALPSGNQAFRELTFKILTERAEGEVKPRVFFDAFPDLVVYVREIPKEGGWRGVFMADSRPGITPSIYLARRGRVIIDREKQTLQVALEDGVRHSGDTADKYEVFRFESQAVNLNPASVFPTGGVPKGAREMSIPELQARAAELEARGVYPHNEIFELHKKFSIPFACVVFGLIGLALGASNRRDGKMASFVVGLAVIFAYYVILWLGQSLVKGGKLPPWLAAWLPNIVLGVAGAMLFTWRDRVADQRLQIPIPGAVRALGRFVAAGDRQRLTRILPLTILDRYVTQTYARVLLLSGLGMAGLFYITTFLDRSEKVLKGDATWGMLGTYFWYMTPQYVYYVIPLSVLLATLVTVGLLTKNSEIVVMKACGISLYRVAVPMLVGGIAAAAVLFAIEQSVLGPSNRRAEAIRHLMNGGSLDTFDVLSRRWVVAPNGAILHYDSFDPRLERFTGLDIYEFDQDMRGVVRRTYADSAVHTTDKRWTLEGGWIREFDNTNEPTFTTLAHAPASIETPEYFRTEAPDPEFMSYSQLRDYTTRLQTTGFDVLGQQVALARKLSFPFVTLVMTLLAVPFAVTVGRGGAMAGIAIAVTLAITYWTATSVFGAMGTGGVLTPVLAAWAPNLLFGAGAIYLLLTVRT